MSRKPAPAKDAKIVVRLADHPRAQRQIRRMRAWGGLIGFVLAGMAANGAGLTAWHVGVRALAGGVVAMLAAWTLALIVWRQLAVAELRAARARVEAEAAAFAEARALAEASQGGEA